MNGIAQTVFIVDDAGEVRAGLSRLLAAAGFDVCAFESAESFCAIMTPRPQAAYCWMFACPVLADRSCSTCSPALRSPVPLCS